jgi:rusticyanin
MMGGMPGYGSGTVATISPAAAAQLGAATPTGATLDRTANTITFTGPAVTIPVVASPPGGQDETFRIAGMTNPTIVVPAGTRVTLELANADEGMVHNWVLSSAEPPFGWTSMMEPVAFGAVTATLPEATSSAVPSATITFDAATAGRFAYLCTVPGHAEEGMFGSFVVTPGRAGDGG